VYNTMRVTQCVAVVRLRQVRLAFTDVSVETEGLLNVTRTLKIGNVLETARDVDVAMATVQCRYRPLV